MKTEWYFIACYFLVWYCATVPVILIIGFFLNWHIFASLIGGHFAWFLMVAPGFIKHIKKQKGEKYITREN